MGRIARAYVSLLISLIALAAAAQEPTAMVKLEWKAVAGAGAYKVDIRDETGRTIASETVTEPEIRLDIVPGEYEMRVTALNRFMQESGSSPWTPFNVRRRRPPFVSSVSPRLVIPKEGGTLVLRGAEYGEDTSVEIGDEGLKPLATRLVSASELRIKLPPIALIGSYDLVVTNKPSLSTRIENAFSVRYPDPVPLSADPAILDFDAADRRVSIGGRSFYEGIGALLVKGGHRVAAPAERISASVLRISVPALLDSGNWDIELANDSTSKGILSGALAILPLVPFPVLGSISPETLVAGSGEKARLRGSGFVQGTRIFIGGQESASVTYISPTEIEFTAPKSAEPGSYVLSAANRSDRTGSLEGPLRLRHPDPIPLELRPSRLEYDDPLRSATLKGLKFAKGARAELFSGESIIGLSLESVRDDAIETAIPEGLAEGSWGIRVMNDDLSVGPLESALKIIPAVPFPVLGEVSPSRLEPGVPSLVSIVGSGFTEDSRAELADGTRLETRFVSRTRLECVLPPREPGPPLGIAVVNRREKGERRAAFMQALQVRHEIPSLSGVSPSSLEVDSRERRLTIKGGPFSPEATLRFIQGDRDLAPEILERRAESLVAELPREAGLGLWSLSVANDAYSIARLEEAFEVLPLVPVPRVVSLELKEPPLGSAATLSVRGTGFREETIIVIGGGSLKPAASRFLSDELIELSLAAGAAGEYSIEAVTREDRRSVFDGKLDIVPFPTIGEVSPSRLDPGESALISIIGSGFMAYSKAALADGTELETRFVSRTRLECAVPAREPGPPLGIVVTNRGERKAELAGALQARHERPLLLGISPSSLEADSRERRLMIEGGAFSPRAAPLFIQGDRELAPEVLERREDWLVVELPAEASPGSWSLRVANDAYSVAGLDKALVVLPPVPIPRVLDLELSESAPGAAALLSVKGTGFQSQTVIIVGGGALKPLASRFVSDRLIELIIPAGAAGEYSIEAITREDRRSVFDGKLDIVTLPTIGEVSPSRLDPGAPNLISIAGSGFMADSRVDLSDGTALETLFVSPTRIQCVVPARSPGPPFGIAIVNRGDRRAELAEALQARHEIPVLTRLVPSCAEWDVLDRRVIIEGGPFAPEAALFLIRGDEKIAPQVFERRADALVFALPYAAEPGIWSLSVANDDYSVARLEDAFDILPPVPKPEPIVLSVFTIGGTEAVWDEFRRENSEIIINIESVDGEAAYDQRLGAYIASGSMPDLFVMKPGEIGSIDEGIYKKHLAKDLGKLLGEEYLTNFIGPAVDPKYHRGGYIAEIPGRVNFSTLMYVNKKLLAENGFPVPTSYQDLATMVPVLRAKGIQALVVPNAGQGPLYSCVFSTVAARLLPDSFIGDVNAGQAKFTDEAFVDALRFIAAMYADGVLNVSDNNLSYGKGRDSLVAGRAAILLEGDWRYADFCLPDKSTGMALISPEAQANDYELVGFPVIPGEMNPGIVPVAIGRGLAISDAIESGSKKEAAAVKLFMYLHSPEGLPMSNVVEKGKLSSRKGISSSKAMPFVRKAMAFQASIPMSSRELSSELDQSVNDILRDGLLKIGRGEATPDTVAASAQAAMDALLRQSASKSAPREGTETPSNLIFETIDGKTYKAGEYLGLLTAKPPDFEDDFVSDRGLWRLSGKESRIADEVLHLSGMNESAKCERMKAKNFIVKFDVTPRKLDTGGNLHVIFRPSMQIDGAGIYDTFHIRDSYYQWHVWEQINRIGGAPAINYAQWGGTGLLMQSGIKVNIVLLVQGNKGAVFLNGKPAGTFKLNEKDGGPVTLNLNSVEGPMSLDFDNVRFWNLDSTIKAAFIDAANLSNGLVGKYHTIGTADDGIQDNANDINKTTFAYGQIDAQIDKQGGFWPFGFDRAFAVSWDGFIKIEMAGLYEFSLKSDNDSHLYIDGGEIAMGSCDVTKVFSKPTDLKPGYYPLRILFFSDGDLGRAHGNDSSIQVFWKTPDNPDPVIVPVGAFFTFSDISVSELLNPVMVFVPGGTFTMGDTAGRGRSDEKPFHRVTLSSFYIGSAEVTQGEYNDLIENDSSFDPGDNLPVTGVTWFEAVRYCNERSLKEGLSPAYTISENAVICDWTAAGYRLPTEAEWEYAARGRSENETYAYSGSAIVDEVAWYSSNSGKKLRGIGQKKSNALGLLDMSGNAAEWCWDWYSPYGKAEYSDPRGASAGAAAVVRGGGWDVGAYDLRVSSRTPLTPGSANASTGFRVVRRGTDGASAAKAEVSVHGDALDGPFRVVTSTYPADRLEASYAIIRIIPGNPGNLEIWRWTDDERTKCALFGNWRIHATDNPFADLVLVSAGPETKAGAKPGAALRIWYETDPSGLLRVSWSEEALRDGLYTLLARGLTTPTAGPSPPEPFATIGGNAYTAEEYAEAVSTSISGRAPDYQDDFEDRTGGWQSGKLYRFLFFDKIGERRYIDGEYSIEAAKSSDAWAKSRRIPLLSDFVIETDFRFMPGGDKIDWRFDFRSSPSGSGFSMLIYKKGELTLTYDVKNKRSIRILERVPLDSFNPEAVNRVRLIVKGMQAIVSLNGRLVANIPRLYFPADAKAGISIHVENPDEETGSVRFDNLGIWDISGAIAQAPIKSDKKSAPSMDSIPPGMVYIRGGSFRMGSMDGEDNERPIHEVHVSDFMMGKYEVRQREWSEIMGSNPSRIKEDDLPVDNVSWYDAIDYCNARSKKEGLNPSYAESGADVTCDITKNGYRLPTEAEWEYAAREGESSNELALFDMDGIILEWCWDRYSKYSGIAQTDPLNITEGQSFRIVRGGLWTKDSGAYRTHRSFDSPSCRMSSLGFRIVRSAAASAAPKLSSESASNCHFNPANGNYYQIVTVEDGVDWDQAKRYAENMTYSGMPGHLATITSPEENAFVYNDLMSYEKKDALIGAYCIRGTDGEGNGKWKWVTDEAMDYTHWQAGEGKQDIADKMKFARLAGYGWIDEDAKEAPLEGGWPKLVVEYETRIDRGIQGKYYSFGKHGDGIQDYNNNIAKCKLEYSKAERTIPSAKNFWPFGYDHAFAVEFSGFIKIDEEGEYRFSSDSDDELFLFLDSKQLFKSNATTPAVSEYLHLEKGYHRLVIRFFGNGDLAQKTSGNGSRIFVKWEKGSGGFREIPAEALFPVEPSPEKDETRSSKNGDRIGSPIRGEILVEGGSFQMGFDSPLGWLKEIPVHSVAVSPFWMMKTEVMQGDYAAVAGSNPSGFRGGSLPVETVSWYDAVIFANLLSERDGLAEAYNIIGPEVSCNFSANGWRLPTEAEWEFAARGGVRGKGYDYAGSNYAGDVAWSIDNSGGRTHEAATKEPNELGLFDFCGNVWEWCWDSYGPYTEEATTDPAGASSGSGYRIARGGSHESRAYHPAFRFWNSPELCADNLGFRLVRSLFAPGSKADAPERTIAPRAKTDSPEWTFVGPYLEYSARTPPDFEDDFSEARGWKRSPSASGASAMNTLDMRIEADEKNVFYKNESLNGENFILSFDVMLYDNFRNPLELWWRITEKGKYRLFIGRDGYFSISYFLHDDPRGDVLLSSIDVNEKPTAGFVNICLIAYGRMIFLNIAGKPLLHLFDAGRENSRESGFFFNPGSEATARKADFASIDNVKYWNLDKPIELELPPFMDGMNLAVSGASCLFSVGGLGASVPPGVAINGEKALTISADGFVALGRDSGDGSGPDGNEELMQRTPARSGFKRVGISALTSPAGSLIGVFLPDDIAIDSRTPSELAVASIRSFVSSPDLGQSFFIGAGPRAFAVPKGATRLYLGVNDAIGWEDNVGEFIATITESFLADPEIIDGDVEPGLVGDYYSVGKYGDGAQDAVDDENREKWDFQFTSIDGSIDYPRDKQFWPFGYDHAFAVEWTGLIKVKKAGIHGFRIDTSKRARLFIDGLLVLSSLDINTIQSLSIFLDAGFHEVTIIFSSDGDVQTNNHLRLQWHRPSDWLNIHVPISPSLYHAKERG